MGIDYYGVLSLNRTCTFLDIKQRYRKMALAMHPLRKPYPPLQPMPVMGPPIVTWEQLGEAYDVLSDPLKREIFDQFGEEGLKKGVPAPDGFIVPYVYHGDAMKTYTDFFGTSSAYADLTEAINNPPPIYDLPLGRGVKAKDKPIIKPLFLTLNEVYHGGMKKMKVQHLVFCDEQHITTELREKILSVPIKQGVLPGTHITFEREGDEGPTQEAADIVFITTDRPHEVFSRDGAHLIMNVSVCLKDALCGTSVTVHTLDNRIVRVPITNIISPSYEKVVVGEGMPRVDDPRTKGDLVIKFTVIFPDYLPKKSKQLIAKAFLIAEQDDSKTSCDNIHRRILADKMNRIAIDERLPKF